ncbi:DUF6528 family protein [Mucilaginibacter boryungensis]|uniref:Uncharacterized protein n=1 Tax=Mucilaginibacter boryungensis TaxID=768480 RepID=A0ABR9XE64_9SPHI|nr:DUF6528 family protein [Mucilaginibacter boryungensis]MBE9665551.1 hypothetical protein [Mucilaginibacter boryungensis]
MKYICLLFLLVGLTSKLYSQPAPEKLFLVCGDTKVLLVNYTTSKDSIPNIIWSWDAATAHDLPDDMRKKFKTLDDCKHYGDLILVSSSGGAIAVINKKTDKIIFYADVAMAHSVESLPGGLLAAAASTHVKGNKLMVFDPKKGNTPVYTDSLYSGHGVVWDAVRKSLYTLNYNALREYKLNSANGIMALINEWKIPGKGGHDLQMAPDGKRLFLTTETSSHEFNLVTHQFTDIRGWGNIPNIKSVGQNQEGQFIYTLPEESWWTYHVKFSNPARVFTFGKMHVYKARWY